MADDPGGRRRSGKRGGRQGPSSPPKAAAVNAKSTAKPKAKTRAKVKSKAKAKAKVKSKAKAGPRTDGGRMASPRPTARRASSSVAAPGGPAGKGAGPGRQAATAGKSTGAAVRTETAATAQKVAASLTSTRQGLESFREVVDRSGLRKALPEYSELARVIVDQRAWAENAGIDELGAPFGEVAAVAGDLHAIFAGYAEVFGAIAGTRDGSGKG